MSLFLRHETVAREPSRFARPGIVCLMFLACVVARPPYLHADASYVPNQIVVTFAEEYMPSPGAVVTVPASIGEASVDALFSACGAFLISKVIPSYNTYTLFAPVVRDAADELFFGVRVVETFAGSSASLGRLVFDVAGETPFELTPDDFVLSVGDVLVDAPENNVVVAAMGGEFTRRFDPAVARIYHDRLEQNFPNPFNPTTTIAFSIKSASNVTLTIYDVAGRRVRELVNERRERGAYKVLWDGRNDDGAVVSSGTYFYKLKAGTFTDTKKLTLLK